jgi:drug/metabolite transporter (DMT)-like permease
LEEKSTPARGITRLSFDRLANPSSTALIASNRIGIPFITKIDGLHHTTSIALIFLGRIFKASRLFWYCAMTHLSTPALPSSQSTFPAHIWLWIGLVVLGWSTSWIALHYQVGVVPPEVSLFWRFGLAGAIMMVICLVRRAPLRGYGLRDHAHFLGLGLTLFSFNFFCFYTAGLEIVSGLLSVVFALAAPGNMLMQALVLRQRVPLRVAAGSAIGFFGLIVLFAPEIGISGLQSASSGSLILALLGVTLFCTGNYMSVRINRRGVALLPSIAWGMGYGALASAVFAFWRGQPFALDFTAPYLASLLWAALVSSVLAFLAYLNLLRTIGPARTGYLTVLFPVIALLISTFAEDYHWTLWSLAGLALVGIGNILVLRSRS